jgi:hypothetical protein
MWLFFLSLHAQRHLIEVERLGKEYNELGKTSN